MDSVASHLPEKLQLETNREDLEYFLSFLEPSAPENPWHTPEIWDNRADLWEKERELQRKRDERVENTMEFLMHKGILNEHCRVADIGCGPGRFAAAFARHAQWVVGYDLSPRMAAYGNAYLQSQGLTNAQICCRRFSSLDIEAEGLQGAFDLVFSSLTPAVHTLEGLLKSIDMSRGWCLNISRIHRSNPLREQLLREGFGTEPESRAGGEFFYSLFNLLFLLGYRPETSFFTRRKENRVRPDEAYASYVMEHALPHEAHSPENKRKILEWLLAHTEDDGFLTDASEGVYGRILWDVRIRDQRPDYPSIG